jgi:drug/metabolite transporter (DMT)-like permease
MNETDQWVNLSGADWVSLAYATIFGSALAYGVFFYLASSGSLTSLSSLTFLTPVFALLFGSLFLSEKLSSIQWIGVGFTLVSIYLVNQREYLLEALNVSRLWGTAPTDLEANAEEESSSRPAGQSQSG